MSDLVAPPGPSGHRDGVGTTTRVGAGATLDDGIGRADLGRLLVAAVSVVVGQSAVIEPSGFALVRWLDLPLALAAALVIVHPTRSTTIGLVIGLTVDAFGQRLFGLHCLAYAVLGPMARLVPTPVGRRSLAVAWTSASQALAVTAVVVAGQSVAAGAVAADPLERLAATAAWTALVAVPLVARAERTPSGPGPERRRRFGR